MSYSLGMRPFGSPAQLEDRRLHAISLLEKGLQPVDIARKLKVDRRSVRRWKSSFLKAGKSAIKAKPAPGRPPRLDARGKRKLERELLRGAQQAGYPTDLWTCPRIAKLVRLQFKVEYHVHHIPRLLRSLGWSPQKPEKRARERDEKVVQKWIKEDWVRIKKKPAA
jgi:transposase